MNVILHGTKRMYAVTVGTTPTLISNTGRRNGLVFRNNSDDVTIYLGGSDVTTSTGFPLLEDEVLVDEDSYDPTSGNADSWYAVVASDTADLRVIEYV